MPPDTKQVRADYTEGPILRSILKMGLPSMFGFLSQSIYSFADTFWVSRLPDSVSGVAAITFFATILWFFFSFNQLVGPGSVAIISRRYGEKNYDRAETAIKETLILKLIFGGIFGIVGYFTVGYMLKLMGAEETALLMGIEYGQIMFMGMAIMYATYSYYTAMRGVANPHMAMNLMIASNLLNVILDPIFIFGYLGVPALGIKGAAIASVLSYTITFATGAYLFYAGKTNVPLNLTGNISVSVKSMLTMLKIGAPAWAGSMSYSGARLVITPLVARFGTKVVAAYGIANQVTGFGIMLLVGIGMGVSSLIGHNLGSGKVERAKKTADSLLFLNVVIMMLVSLITFFFAGQIIQLFFDDPETIEAGVLLLKVFAVGFPFLGLFFGVEEIHMGVGLNTPSMIVNIIHSWFFEVIPIYVLTKHLGYSEVAIWWIISGAGAVTSIAFYLYYRRGRWMTVKV